MKVVLFLLFYCFILIRAQDYEETITDSPEITEGLNPPKPLGSILWSNRTVEAVAAPYPPNPDDRRRCPKWGPWENVTCWWPSIAYDRLPKSCTALPLPKKVPAVIRQLFESKIRELYNMLAFEYNQRSKPPLCGHCSFSFKCRVRSNSTEDGDYEEFDSSEQQPMFGRDRRRPHRREKCIPKEIKPFHANCTDTKPCEINKVFGGCPTPFFLRRGGLHRAKPHMEKGDYMSAIDELARSLRMSTGDNIGENGFDFGNFNVNEEEVEDNGRMKREAGFEDDDDAYEPTYTKFMRDQPVDMDSDDEAPMRPMMDEQEFPSPPRRGRYYPRPQMTPPNMYPRPPMPPQSDSPSEEDSPRWNRRRWMPPRMRALFRRRYMRPPPANQNDRVGAPNNDFMTKTPFMNFMSTPGFHSMSFWHRPGGPGFGGGPKVLINTRPPKPSPRKMIIYWLLHGTKCISSGNACLCCCSHYVPNAQTKTCDDIKSMLPGFDNMVDAILNTQDADVLTEPLSVDDTKRPPFMPKDPMQKLVKNPEDFR